MKLYTQPGSFRAQKIIIAAQYAGQKLEIITDATSAAIKAKSAIAKYPLLEVQEGCISESNAIARYIANLKPESGLTAGSLLEKAQVDSWVDFCSNEIEVPATVWVYPIIGWMAYHHEASEKSKKDLKAALQVLESHLKSRTFLVGESITLADVAIACALLLPMKIVLDEKTRKPYPCVTRWFLTCVNQKQFSAVIGEVTLCKVALAASGAEQDKQSGKTEKKGGDKKAEKKTEKKVEKKEEKKKAEKKEEAKPAAEEMPEDFGEESSSVKKQKHPLEDLPKSSFVLDAWKREYSNAPGGDCYKTMPWLWANFDKNGFSIYHAKYNYNDELKVGFMVSNLAAGFVQRCDEIRKYAFGVIQILGENGGHIEIRQTWIFRGPDEKLMLEVNPDADNYEWTKVTDLENEGNKKYIADMFCAGEEIDGLPILDCKVFK